MGPTLISLKTIVQYVKLLSMLKRIWFPGLVALIIIGLIYWFFVRTPSVAPVGSTSMKNEAYSNLDEPAGQALNQNPSMSDTSTQTNTTSMQNISSATLHTNMGDITIQFDTAATPKTVANFVKLASTGFYDGTKFHRVIAGFMNQGGDPFSKDDSLMARWGTGGPGYQFADEIGPNNRNAPGTISMANAGPNTNGSQFFLNVGDNSFLDTKHTVFGKVVAGLDVVMAINATKTGENDRPITPVVIKSIDLK